MKIISTTLTNSRSDVIGKSLSAIVDQVDECIVIDTGITDDTMKIARVVAGSKLREFEYGWHDDFAEARNFAKDCAEDLGADWIITADTDDQLHLPGLREFLRIVPPHIDCVLVNHVSKSFRQYRIIRAGSPLQWAGAVHEAIDRPEGLCSIHAPEGWHFKCIPRPAEDIKAKMRGYLKTLTNSVASDPTCPRSWYYLGDTLSTLGDIDGALGAFEKCSELSGWDEQTAWACYRAASLYLSQARRDAALDACMRGLEARWKTAELHWLAGSIFFHMRDFQAAEEFARSGLKVQAMGRVGFSDEWVREHGCADLLRCIEEATANQ